MPGPAAGAPSSRGQASHSSAVSTAALMSSTASMMPANPSQDPLSVNSQRRSW